MSAISRPTRSPSSRALWALRQATISALWNRDRHKSEQNRASTLALRVDFRHFLQTDQRRALGAGLLIGSLSICLYIRPQRPNRQGESTGRNPSE